MTSLWLAADGVSAAEKTVTGIKKSIRARDKITGVVR